jgi:hypothetical protein
MRWLYDREISVGGLVANLVFLLLLAVMLVTTELFFTGRL